MNLLKIGLYNLFWFALCKVIIISWHLSRVWQGNPSWIKLFFLFAFYKVIPIP